MIIFPASLLTDAAVSLKNARIGYQTWLRDLLASAITVSSATAAGPKDAPLRPDTYEYWEPSALPATWMADFGQVRDIDYVGVAAHTLGSEGCTLEVRHSLDTEFEDYLSLSALDANYASTPDSAANSITGDLHVELELAIDNADLPDFSLDFLGDFTASVTKITDDGTFTRAGDTATRITSAGLVANVLANVTRQDFNPITRAVRGLFIEEARTNLCLQSENLATTWANTGSTETTNAIAAPDGASTADKLVEDSSTGAHAIFQSITKAGSALSYAFSVFLKAGEHSIARLRLSGSAGTNYVEAYFDLSAGSISGAISTNGVWVVGAANITAYPDGWYRCDVSGTSDTTTDVIPQIWLTNSGSYTGDGASGVYVWGAQVEQASFVSSYIATTTGSVARAADVGTLTDLTAMGFNAVEGTLIASAEAPNNPQTGAFGRLVQIGSGSGNERMWIARNTQAARLGVDDGGVSQTANSLGSWADAAVAKVAGVYKPNDFSGSLNGAAVVTDASGTLPTVDRLNLGNGDSAAFFNGWIREFYYYATRRVNATLQDFSRQTYRCLASKWAETSDQRSWALCLKENCALVLFVSTDGTAAGIREYHSAPMTVTEGVRFRIRVQLDIESGSPVSDSVCTFETSSDDGATWDPLSTVTQASVSGIFNSTAPLEVGAFNGGTSEFDGRIFEFILRQSIGGGIAAQFAAADADDEDDTTITSSATGEVWTIHSTGVTPAELVLHTFGSGSLAPADDAPIMLLDSTRSARYLRLGITGAGDAPRIASIYAGEVLAMERAIRGGGFVPPPLGRNTVLHRSLSRGGQFLSQGYRRHGIETTVNFTLLTAAWVRSDFDPFIKAARRYPYFLAWRPETHPLEVAYVWTDKDIHPSMQGLGSKMQVSWPISGIGNE